MSFSSRYSLLELRIQQPVIAHPVSSPVVPEGARPIPLPTVSEDVPPQVQLSLPERARPRYFKWLRRSTPALQTFLHRVRLSFFNRPQAHDNEAMEVLERPPSVVDVPLAHGLPVSTFFPSQMFDLNHVPYRGTIAREKHV